MRKGAKQTDPLRPRASRVEKARVSRAGPPSWYYRVLNLRWDKSLFDDQNPGDFDEDLSELEEESEQEDDAEQLVEEEEDCECGGEDSECDCHFSDGIDMEDVESERSYDGSDADYYYDLKEQREERKRELLEERKDKERQFEFEKSKEEEVRAAYKSLRKAEKDHTTIPVQLAGQRFNLFCSDHVNHFYDSDFYPTKWVEFSREYRNNDSNEPDVKNPKSGGETGMLRGAVWLGDYTYCHFGPFRPGTQATWKPVKVKSCEGEYDEERDEEYELSFQFIGNGYLKLRVSRDMVFMDSDEDPPPNAPEVFDFVGIWRDPEKEKAEQQKIEMERRQRRSPSPRETWFELNHPHGAYGRYGGY